MELSRILCPIDFSEFSRHALDQALAIAHCCGGIVSALHVMPLVPYGDPLVTPAVMFTPEAVERTARELETFVSQEAGRAVDSRVLQGHVVNTIAAEAESIRADLIVMGTHGRSGFERLMLGSVTERVLRKAPCPVLTVPPRAPDVVAAGPAPFRRILCATDYSAVGERAVAYAASLARQCDAQLAVMNVVEALSVYEPLVLETGMAMIEDLRRESAKQLSRVAASTNLTGVREILTTGNPSRQILGTAADDGSDLIVIGVHSGLADRFHLGSVANRIVRSAQCAVLTVR